MRSGINSGFFGLQLSRSMPPRKSRYLLGRAQFLPVFRDLCSSCIISEGFKSTSISLYPFERSHELNAEYWRDLGQSSKFEGQILIDCVHRIHEDVLKVWNLNDPTKVSCRIPFNSLGHHSRTLEILSGTDFFTQMIGLVKPLIDDQVDQTLCVAFGRNMMHN